MSYQGDPDRRSPYRRVGGDRDMAIIAIVVAVLVVLGIVYLFGGRHATGPQTTENVPKVERTLPQKATTPPANMPDPAPSK